MVIELGDRLKVVRTQDSIAQERIAHILDAIQDENGRETIDSFAYIVLPKDKEATAIIGIQGLDQFRKLDMIALLDVLRAELVSKTPELSAERTS